MDCAQLIISVKQNPCKPRLAVQPLLIIILAAITIFGCRSNDSKLTTLTIGDDGSVNVVESYIRQQLKCPESFQAIHWTKLQRKQDLSGDSVYTLSVIYRSKNKDGKTYMSSKRFDFDKHGLILFEMGIPPFQEIAGNQ